MRNRDKSKKFIGIILILLVIGVLAYILSADVEIKTEPVQKDITAEVIK